MIVGSQFILNLFVGVVIDNFNKIKESEEMGDLFVTQGQREWIDIQHIVLRKTLQKKEVKPKNPFRRMFFYLVTHKVFEIFITLCILANTIVMSVRHARMTASYELILSTLNMAFSIIFNIECVAKIIGLGRAYFYTAWNRFDMFIVIGTDVGFIVNIMF